MVDELKVFGICVYKDFCGVGKNFMEYFLIVVFVYLLVWLCMEDLIEYYD